MCVCVCCVCVCWMRPLILMHESPTVQLKMGINRLSSQVKFLCNTRLWLLALWTKIYDSVLWILQTHWWVMRPMQDRQYLTQWDIGEGLRSLLHCTTEDFVPQPLFLHLDSRLSSKTGVALVMLCHKCCQLATWTVHCRGQFHRRWEHFWGYFISLQGLPWQSVIFGRWRSSILVTILAQASRNQPSSILSNFALIVCNFGSFKNFGVCDNVVLIQVEDDVREMLMEILLKKKWKLEELRWNEEIREISMTPYTWLTSTVPLPALTHEKVTEVCIHPTLQPWKECDTKSIYKCSKSSPECKVFLLN